MQTILIEKINHRFKRITQSKDQATGLSVCLDMIAKSVPGIMKIEVDDVEHIIIALQRYRPKNVLIQAIWVSKESLMMLKSKFPKTNIYIHIHSKIPFLAAEGHAMIRINEAFESGCGVVVNNELTHHAIPGSTYLPNIYAAKIQDRGPVWDPKKETFDVICGGSLRPMKNHLSQAIAAIKAADKFKKKLRFHVNMGRNEGGDDIKMNLLGLFQRFKNHELISIPWMSHSEFINYCGKMDVGMQVSMSESFNIVAADYVAAGISMVVSPEIEWAHPVSVVNPGDVDAIANRMFCMPSSILSRHSLNNFSENSKKIWSQFNEA